MKNILIISSSPNSDGLTAKCAENAEKGVKKACGNAVLVRLNGKNIEACRACGNGWGICRTQHVCVIKDDFADIGQQIADCSALIVITPVYWGEMSEISKSFFDRLRRCEASKHFGQVSDDAGASVLEGKNVVLVAAAGGSGNGTLTCLSQMENLIRHVGGKVFDRITVTRFNKRYKLQTIAEAAFEAVNPEIKQ